jgi:Sec-independent protein translocase protein TatA
MESKKGAFIVLGLLLVLTVVLLVVGAKRSGTGGANAGDTAERWKKGILSSFAKSQQLPAADLKPNPFNASGEATISLSVPLVCQVAPSSRAVRSAKLELAGPGKVDVELKSRRKGRELDFKKKLERSSAGGTADKDASFDLTAFEEGGTLTITNHGGPAAAVKLRWTFE